MPISEEFAIAIIILYVLFIALYIVLFAYTFISTTERHSQLRAFHNAICTFKYNRSLSPEEILDQIQISYDNIYRSHKSRSKISLLTSLETLIYHFDTYSDKRFHWIYRSDKASDTRSLLTKLRNTLKEQNPYFEVPLKEATLLQDITDTLDADKKNVGISLLNRLAQEILAKEKIIKNQNTANIVSITVSVLGLILSTVFGIMQFI